MTVAAAVLAALVALATLAAFRWHREQLYYWATDELVGYLELDVARYDRDIMRMLCWVPERVIDYALAKGLTLFVGGPADRPFLEVR